MNQDICEFLKMYSEYHTKKMETLGIEEDVTKGTNSNMTSQKYNNTQSYCREVGCRLKIQNDEHPYTLDELTRAQVNEENNQTNSMQYLYCGQTNDREITKNEHLKNRTEENYHILQYKRTTHQSKDDFLVENYQHNSKNVIQSNESLVECNDKESPEKLKIALNYNPLQSEISIHQNIRVIHSMSIEHSNHFKETMEPTNCYVQKFKPQEKRLDEAYDYNQMQPLSKIKMNENDWKGLSEIKKSEFNEYASETEEITDNESSVVEIYKPMHRRKRLVLKYLNRKYRHYIKKELKSTNGLTSLQQISKTGVVSIVQVSDIEYLENSFNFDFEKCEEYREQEESTLQINSTTTNHDNNKNRFQIIPDIQSNCNRGIECVLHENIQTEPLDLTKYEYDDFEVIGCNKNTSYEVVDIFLPLEHNSTSIETYSKFKYQAGNNWSYQRKDHNAYLNTITIDNKSFTSDNPNVISITRNDSMRNIFAHSEQEPNSTVHMISKSVVELQRMANISVHVMDPYGQTESEPFMVKDRNYELHNEVYTPTEYTNVFVVASYANDEEHNTMQTRRRNQCCYVESNHRVSSSSMPDETDDIKSTRDVDKKKKDFPTHSKQPECTLNLNQSSVDKPVVETPRIAQNNNSAPSPDNRTSSNYYKSNSSSNKRGNNKKRECSSLCSKITVCVRQTADKLFNEPEINVKTTPLNVNAESDEFTNKKNGNEDTKDEPCCSKANGRKVSSTPPLYNGKVQNTQKKPYEDSSAPSTYNETSSRNNKSMPFADGRCDNMTRKYFSPCSKTIICKPIRPTAEILFSKTTIKAEKVSINVNTELPVPDRSSSNNNKPDNFTNIREEKENNNDLSCCSKEHYCKVSSNQPFDNDKLQETQEYRNCESFSTLFKKQNDSIKCMKKEIRDCQHKLETIADIIDESVFDPCLVLLCTISTSNEEFKNCLSTRADLSTINPEQSIDYIYHSERFTRNKNSRESERNVNGGESQGYWGDSSESLGAIEVDSMQSLNERIIQLLGMRHSKLPKTTLVWSNPITLRDNKEVLFPEIFPKEIEQPAVKIDQSHNQKDTSTMLEGENEEVIVPLSSPKDSKQSKLTIDQSVNKMDTSVMLEVENEEFIAPLSSPKDSKQSKLTIYQIDNQMDTSVILKDEHEEFIVPLNSPKESEHSELKIDQSQNLMDTSIILEGENEEFIVPLASPKESEQSDLTIDQCRNKMDNSISLEDERGEYTFVPLISSKQSELRIDQSENQMDTINSNPSCCENITEGIIAQYRQTDEELFQQESLSDISLEGASPTDSIIGEENPNMNTVTSCELEQGCDSDSELEDVPSTSSTIQEDKLLSDVDKGEEINEQETIPRNTMESVPSSILEKVDEPTTDEIKENVSIDSNNSLDVVRDTKEKETFRKRTATENKLKISLLRVYLNEDYNHTYDEVEEDTFRDLSESIDTLLQEYLVDHAKTTSSRKEKDIFEHEIDPGKELQTITSIASVNKDYKRSSNEKKEEVANSSDTSLPECCDTTDKDAFEQDIHPNNSLEYTDSHISTKEDYTPIDNEMKHDELRQKSDASERVLQSVQSSNSITRNDKPLLEEKKEFEISEHGGNSMKKGNHCRASNCAKSFRLDPQVSKKKQSDFIQTNDNRVEECKFCPNLSSSVTYETYRMEDPNTVTPTIISLLCNPNTLANSNDGNNKPDITYIQDKLVKTGDHKTMLEVSTQTSLNEETVPSVLVAMPMDSEINDQNKEMKRKSKHSLPRLLSRLFKKKTLNRENKTPENKQNK